MATIKATGIESFLVARAINPAIAENWTEEDWGDEALLSQLRWEKVGTITTKPKPKGKGKDKFEFSEDYSLFDVEACRAVGKEIDHLRTEAAARMVTIQIRGNVYRVSRY